MVYNQLCKRSIELEQKIQYLQQQLKDYPEDNLICARNGKFIKWYTSNPQGITYLPKNKQHIAQQLARKKYLSYLLEDFLSEKKAIASYLKKYNPNKRKSMSLLDESSSYKELLTSYFQSTSDKLLQWKNSDYEQNTKFPEQLIYKTISGNTVRSKSEAIIDMTLYLNNIPFRYECALTLGDSTFFPDFTIYHPKTNQLFYWEHFGMMDQPSYAKNTYSKLQFYSSYNLIPTINLITTFETKSNPLDLEVVEKIIQHYFSIF